jgi:hypothetical protein
MRNPSHLNWRDLSWPSLTICAILGGLILATQTSPETFNNLVRDTLYRRKAPVKAEPDRVLIVTDDPAHRRQVLATLEPRGWVPMIAKSLAEAAAQMAGRPDAVRAAVLDARVHDSLAIERKLRSSFPATRIVVLPRTIRQEMIGPLLIDRI